MAHAQIIGGKLAICNNGSVHLIGVNYIRKAIKQIEASDLALKPSTVDALSIYKDAVALWAMRR